MGTKTCYTARDPPMQWEGTTTTCSYYINEPLQSLHTCKDFTLHVLAVSYVVHCCILQPSSTWNQFLLICCQYIIFLIIYMKVEEEAMQIPSIRDFAIELVSLLLVF